MRDYPGTALIEKAIGTLRKWEMPLMLISVLLAVGCADRAFEAICVNTSDDREIIRHSAMPPEAYLTYSRIAEKWTVFAADYWETVVYDGDRARWDYVIGEMHRAAHSTAEIDANIRAATTAEFKTEPNPKKDLMFMKSYQRIQAAAPNLKRREAFSERFKDMMFYVCGVLIFGGVVWFMIVKERKSAATRQSSHRKGETTSFMP